MKNPLLQTWRIARICRLATGYVVFVGLESVISERFTSKLNLKFEVERVNQEKRLVKFAGNITLAGNQQRGV